jgi:hypothetical protein
MNNLSGFQVIAINGLQTNSGLAPPNISANLTIYNNLPPVSNYNEIYTASFTAPITTPNALALRALGSYSFPHLFGVVPSDFDTNLGLGSLFPKVVVRVNSLFGNVSSPSIFAQALYQAQSYANQSADTINSAASTTWNGSPSSSIMGGLDQIFGTDPNTIAIISAAFNQLGSLVQFSNPSAGFSNAGVIQQILKGGNNTIGNLHLNFFGKTIIDPVTGNVLTVNQSLITSILSAPYPLDNSSFQMVYLNPLDQALGILLNEALTNTLDLDAVITFIGVSGTAAASINQFTDCLNPQLMLGSAAQLILNNIRATTTILDAQLLISTLINSVRGLNNVPSINQLSTLTKQIKPLGNLPLIASMSSPISQTDFRNLQISLGPGSGANGNPTVSDILGATNLQTALGNVLIGLNSVKNSTVWNNISTDTSNVATALIGGISSPVFLSDGTSYTDLNLLSAAAVILTNNNANLLVSDIQSFGLGNLFSDYNGLAETHNNSIVLLTKAGINIANISNNISSLVSLGATVPGMTTQNVETSGLDVLMGVIDNTTLPGQALSATIIETQNSQVFQTNKIATDRNESNPNILNTPPTGTNIIGGGRVR